MFVSLVLRPREGSAGVAALYAGMGRSTGGSTPLGAEAPRTTARVSDAASFGFFQNQKLIIE